MENKKKIIIFFFIVFILEIINFLFLLFNFEHKLLKILINSVILLFSYIFIICFLKLKTYFFNTQIIQENIQKIADNFNMYGLILTDESNNILWINDFLKKRNIKVIGKNILQWKPELKNINENDIVEIIINLKIYNVRYFKKNNLYLLKDISDLKAQTVLLNEQRIVIGTIIIDNYSIVSNNYDYETTILLAQKKIFEYIEKYNGFICKYRDGCYLVICYFSDFKVMQDDKFSFLNQIKLLNLTLSIGFAYNFFNIIKLNKMSNDAVNIAINRGGDQIVINKYGDKLCFFGGKTESLKLLNKPKIRNYTNYLVNTIRNDVDEILVLSHKNIDMDGFGSFLGILSICDHFGKKCKVVINNKNDLENKVEKAFSHLLNNNDIFINYKNAFSSITSRTLIILVDCNESNVCNKELLNNNAKKIIIDHHRPNQIFPTLFSYIDISATSTIELICELISYYASLITNFKINQNYATIMMSGILMDSNFLKSSTTNLRTFEIMIFLTKFGANKRLAINLLKDNLEEYLLISKYISNLKNIGNNNNFFYCLVDDIIVTSSFLAKIAEQCINLENIKAIFVIGKINKTDIYLSCRSNGSINVQLFNEKLGGGGNFTSAATLFKNKKIDEIKTFFINTFNEFFVQKDNKIKNNNLQEKI